MGIPESRADYSIIAIAQSLKEKTGNQSMDTGAEKRIS